MVPVGGALFLLFRSSFLFWERISHTEVCRASWAHIWACRRLPE